MLSNKESSKKGKLFVLSAPSGTGKTTLIRKVTKNNSCVLQSISFTTRTPRKEEKEGRDYFFITESEFQAKIKKGQFLEHIEIFKNRYGTCKQWVEEHLRSGKNVVLVIDTQGALALKEKGGEITLIFLKPPSLKELARRLKKRKTESHEAIEKRLTLAEEEIKKSIFYDYVIVNDNLEVAYQEIIKIFN